ncbi:MAG TPA: hypothetical protein VG125_02040 [Pirellulales bacterium]|jgi:hypothetical protein|nr:hypothetical protein [Pirellulales bacterium]
MSTTGQKMRRRFAASTGIFAFCLSGLAIYSGGVPSREHPTAAADPATGQAVARANVPGGEQPDSPRDEAAPAPRASATPPPRLEPETPDGHPAADGPREEALAESPAPLEAPVAATVNSKTNSNPNSKAPAPSVKIGVDQLTGTVVYIPFVASAAPRPRVRDENGVVFSGRSDQIALVKTHMRQLLAQMGWTANQVLVREFADGERIAFTLNSVPGDTNTFVLAQQRQLGIAPEVIGYVDRKGQKKTLALVSQKEILAAMLQAGRTFLFSGANCRVDLLKEQIALRQNVVYWGMRADWVFPEDKLYRYNTADYWQVMKGDEWTLKPGVKPSEAIADAFVGKFSYQIGCTSACRFIFAHGILDFYAAVRPNTAIIGKLAQVLDGQHPFIDIAPTVDRKRVVVKEGRLMERHTDVPWNHWVPGDWGWIRNDDNKSAEELGSEGCNIIYAGGGHFVNYYPERPPKTLDQAINRVFGWRFGLEESELDLPDDLMQQLRQDPRAGGMLRDVRDYPRTFGAAGPVQPGA